MTRSLLFSILAAISIGCSADSVSRAPAPSQASQTPDPAKTRNNPEHAAPLAKNEVKTMDSPSPATRAKLPLDRKAPSRFETATFGLG